MGTYCVLYVYVWYLHTGHGRGDKETESLSTYLAYLSICTTKKQILIFESYFLATRHREIVCKQGGDKETEFESLNPATKKQNNDIWSDFHFGNFTERPSRGMAQLEDPDLPG